MRICFIVHGNEKIGMGHVMRSLVLAAAFRDLGYTVFFFSKYILAIELIKKWGFPVYTMPTYKMENSVEGFFYGNQEELENDAKYVYDKLEQKVDVIIVDSYNVTCKFFESVKAKTNCLVYLDDINAFSYPVDILINGSASAENMHYQETQSAKLLLGLKYNLVRREFYKVPKRKVREEIKDVFISTGNSDPYHMTEKIVNCLFDSRKLCGLRYHIVVGSGFDDMIWKNPVIVKNKLSIILYKSPNHMAKIMMKCDIAISAGGTTLYELAACGVPMIVFAYAENQVPQIEALKKLELIQYMGYYQEVKSEVLIEYMEYMLREFQYRKRIVPKLQDLVDGRGGERIVKEIVRRG